MPFAACSRDVGTKPKPSFSSWSLTRLLAALCCAKRSVREGLSVVMALSAAWSA